MDVKLIAIDRTVRTNDGLEVRITIEVKDALGLADMVAQDIVDFVDALVQPVSAPLDTLKAELASRGLDVR